ncbi:hypothetical protein TrRE_jg3062, partial [Triparma retinervis]
GGGGGGGGKTRVVCLDLKKDNTRQLKKHIFQLGGYVNERRARKGIKGRPIRVGVVGYPNTGKSTLINKLVGRKRCKAENTPGVTRGLTWVKVKQEDKKGSSLASGVAGGSYTKQSGTSDEFELLDTPGIIPKKLDNHLHAHMLAACNAVGRKGYDGQRVAAWLLGWFGRMAATPDPAGGPAQCLQTAGPDGYVSFIDLGEARRTADSEGIDVPDVVNKGKEDEGGTTTTTGTGGAFEGW